MSANKLRSDSTAACILIALNQVGICFVKDLKLYGSSLSAKVNIIELA